MDAILAATVRAKTRKNAGKVQAVNTARKMTRITSGTATRTEHLAAMQVVVVLPIAEPIQGLGNPAGDTNRKAIRRTQAITAVTGGTITTTEIGNVKKVILNLSLHRDTIDYST